MLDCVIDLSHFNGSPDFSRVKAAGIEAVILKASQGTAWIDPMFHRNLTNAITNNLLVGAYHFGTGDDATIQANHFLSVAGSVPLKVLDFETNTSGQSMTAVQANEFIQVVTSGKFPILYADIGHIQQLAIFPLISQDCPLWIAQYKYEPEPHIPDNTWSKWTLWQYTDSGTVPGVNGKVDRSYFNGEIEDLQALFGL